MNVVPVTPGRFEDLVTLFRPNGTNSGCWCMWWRVSAKEWSANGNAGNRAAHAGAVGRVNRVSSHSTLVRTGLASLNPTFHLRKLDGGSLFDHYLGSFERVWATAMPWLGTEI